MCRRREMATMMSRCKGAEEQKSERVRRKREEVSLFCGIFVSSLWRETKRSRLDDTRLKEFPSLLMTGARV